jgi:hypothetical protein
MWSVISNEVVGLFDARGSREPLVTSRYSDNERVKCSCQSTENDVHRYVGRTHTNLRPPRDFGIVPRR